MMRAPRAYAGGMFHASGGDWVLAETQWRRNPRLALRPVFFHIVKLWSRCRGAMGGTGLLPEPGGVNQQPAWLMAAFALLDGAEADMEKAKDA
ncbi:hypothetical protein [Roseomonas populi]|uniref:Transposase Tn5 dimerisation domain-containing protein n=1 Tax=Roseomonas populi TaxID=3121582 RepID=A0ABT1X111_9PROT|nr:hypothetical protein [Roseomonas pecuniae]MCR0981790.1 hypothetical protein [Roseomonas pecuniae]